MLPTNQKAGKKHFEEALKSGKIYQSALFSIRFLKSSAKKDSRFAFFVPKKVSKLAVTRNFIKRRGYSVIRNVIKEINQGFLVVFLAKKGVEKKEFKDFKEEILSALKKIGAID